MSIIARVADWFQGSPDKPSTQSEAMARVMARRAQHCDAAPEGNHIFESSEDRNCRVCGYERDLPAS